MIFHLHEIIALILIAGVIGFSLGDRSATAYFEQVIVTPEER